MGERAHLVKARNTTYIDEVFFNDEGYYFEWLAAVWGLHPSDANDWQTEYRRDDVKDALDYYQAHKDEDYGDWKATYEAFASRQGAPQARPFTDFIRDVVRFLEISLKKTQTDFIYVEWF